MHKSQSYALKISNISKCFGTTTIFQGLSLEIAPKSTVILLGANGAGKSTLLRICSGLSRAESGQVLFSTSEIESKNKLNVKKGYLAHDLHLYSSLTVLENLLFFAKITKALLDFESYLESWNLSKLKNKKINQLSRGQQVRTALARTFISSPDFIFLDEPTSSLDDLTVDLLISKINEHQAKMTQGCIIIATHDMNRISGLGSRAVVLHEGKIAYDSDSIESSENRYELAISYYREVNR